MKNCQWYYMHHSENGWECLETENGWEWLPRLSQFHLKPGTNGITMRGRNMYTGTGEAELRNRGWSLLKDPSLVAEYQHRITDPGTGRVYWVSAFAEPIWRRGREPIFRVDREGMIDFRRSLVEDGHIAAPAPEFLEELIRVQRRRAGRGVQNVHIPTVKDRVERETAKAAGMQEAASKLAPRPLPRKRRARKPKAASNG